jgi:hypothetical protein
VHNRTESFIGLSGFWPDLGRASEYRPEPGHVRSLGGQVPIAYLVRPYQGPYLCRFARLGTVRTELALPHRSDVAAGRDQIRAALRLTADVVCVATLPAGSSIVDERDWK